MKRATLWLLLAAAAPVSGGTPTLASPDGRFALSPKRVAAGGGAAADARYGVRVTLGQPEASGVITSGRFSATLGLRQRSLSVDTYVFRDGFE